MSHSIPTNAVPDLFKGVVFYLHDTIHPRIRLALEDLLIQWGGQPCPLPSPESNSPTKRFELSKLTHFITDTLHFPEYPLLNSCNTPDCDDRDDKKSKGKGKAKGALGDDHHGDGKYKIVLPAWVTRSFDLQVLQQSRFYSPDPALFLAGTCICTSGLPISDDLTICTAVEAFGGQWRRELTREVTHLLCVAESGKKYEMAIKFGTELGIAIVLPHWFEESLKLNQLVPMDIYRFPSPPYSTSLRDLSSSKPFVERLNEYWKQRLPANPFSASSSNTTSDVTDHRKDAHEELKVPSLTTPTTATHIILGLEQGLTKSTKDKLEDSENYFKSSIAEGYPASMLQRELTDSSLSLRAGNEGRGGALRRSGTTSQSELPNSTSVHSMEANSGRSRAHDSNLSPERRNRLNGNGNPRILEGKKFYLSSDLGLSSGIEQAIVAKIESFGGTAWSFGLHSEYDSPEIDDQEIGATLTRRKKGKTPTTSTERDSWAKRRVAEKMLRAADHVVLRNREGWEYWLTYELGISIGTPAWLFYTFANQTATSPLSRLVHYPPPSRDGVPEFRSKTITVSNYTGLAREYVRTLIELLGAKYEGTMGRNTHFVVTASDIGSKCVHAKSWGIPLVTHLWLESCVLSWTFLSPALSPSYTIASSLIEGTMYPTILGWRSWTKAAIEKWADSIERREERERGRIGVDELEKLERDQVGRDPMELEEAEDLNLRQEKMEIDDLEVNRLKPERDVSPCKQKGASDNSANQDVIEKDQEKPKLDGTTHVTQKKRTSDSKADAVSDRPERERPLPEPSKARSRTKSSRAASPAPPSRHLSTEDADAFAARAEDVKPQSSVKSPSVPAAKDNESSNLTDDEGDEEETTSSSAEEHRQRSPEKAMTKHFGKIDAHNLVPTGTRRAAAVKGEARLHDVIEDKNRFDQEQKSSARKNGGAAAKRRSSQGRESGSPTKARKKSVKVESLSDEETVEEAAEEEETKPAVRRGGVKAKRAAAADIDVVLPPPLKKKTKATAKTKNLKTTKPEETTTQDGAISSFDNPPKAKPSSLKSKRVRIISTGLGLEKTSSEIRDLKPLGVLWTDKPHEATHLVVKSLSRTEKFLCALPYTPFIVTKDWIDACIDAGELVDETPYLLRDKKKEMELGESLNTILARARDRKMFEGKVVYITKGVSPGLPTMQRIVQASGGIVGLHDLKKQHKLIVEDPQALVVSSPNERREWDKLASEGVPIYSCEAVFVAAMHQLLEKGFNSTNRVDAQIST